MLITNKLNRLRENLHDLQYLLNAGRLAYNLDQASEQEAKLGSGPSGLSQALFQVDDAPVV